MGNGTHTYTIDACVSKGSSSRCEVDRRVSRQLMVHLSSSDTPFSVAPSPSHLCSPACEKKDTVTIVCAHVSWDSLLHMIVFAQAISVREQTVCYPVHICSVFKMSRYTREYGQASSWNNRDWAPPAKQHAKNSYPKIN